MGIQTITEYLDTRTRAVLLRLIENMWLDDVYWMFVAGPGVMSE